MGARIKTGRVKANRTYTVEELAECVGVREATIRRWIKGGLRAMTGRRPALVLGADVKAFDSSRRTARKQPLGPGEVFCLGCNAPRSPALAEVEITSIRGNRGLVRGLCPVCERLCTRFVSDAAAEEFAHLNPVANNIGRCP